MESIKPYQLITSVYDLSLAKFIDCICDNNLSVLVIEGEPSDIDLLECWSNLYSQYLDILGNSETLYILQLQKECELLRFKIETAQGILKVLGFFHVEALVTALKTFGFETRQLKQGNSGYERNINKINARLKVLRLRLKEKENELIAINKDQSEDTISRKFFDTQLSRLKKYTGVRIDPKITTVPEYVADLNEYLSQFRKQQMKEDGQER